MAEKKKYNSILTSGRKDNTLTYSKYVKDEESGESVKESLDKMVNKTDKLRTEQLENESVTSEKLAENSVDGRKVCDGSIENRHIGNNAVSTSKIAPRSVTTEKIAYNSVSRAELAHDVRSSIDKKADAEQVNNSLYDLEEKIGERVVVEGDVVNLPDEEDLTSVKESGRDVLKLADRSYAPERFSGKGYKILRRKERNIVDFSKVLQRSIDYVRLTNTPPNESDINKITTINDPFALFAIGNKVYAQKNGVYYTHWNGAYSNHKDFYNDNGELLDNLYVDDVNGTVRGAFFYKNKTWLQITQKEIDEGIIPNKKVVSLDNSDFTANTIHVIRYDYAIAKDITLPKGVTLYYEGGSIKGEKKDSKSAYSRATTYQLKSDGLTELFGNVKNAPLDYRNFNTSNFIINVINEGIDSTGNEDVTDSLNELFKNHPCATFYFPEGIYKISDTIAPFEYGASIIGDKVKPTMKYPKYPRYGTIFKYVPDGINTNRVAIDMTKSKGKITDVNICCAVNDNTQEYAIKIDTSNVPINGSNAQHYKKVSIKEEYKNISGLKLYNDCENVNIYGFSGVGMILSAPNITINNCNIYSCGVSIYTEASDCIIRNSKLREGNIGIIYKGFLKVDNTWIDEFAQFGILQDASQAARQTLELNGVHFNHIDFNAIRIKGTAVSSSGFMSINGVVFSRIGCFYAGYTTDNIPDTDIIEKNTFTLENDTYKSKTLTSCIYAENNILNGLIVANKSDVLLLDNSSNNNFGGTCGTLLLDAKGTISGCNIITTGKYNDGKVLLDSKKNNNYIVYNGTLIS